MVHKEYNQRVAFIGNYLPRQCGIATFTTDLCEAFAEAHPNADVFAIPINDVEDGYDYPPRVRFEVREQELASYRRAAEFLNINNIDTVCLQHEFGIFGGVAGSHIIKLLSDLSMPIVTTLHTVLEKPNAAQRQVMDELTALSDRMVVMSERGRTFLKTIYGVPEERIDLIHHGIPDVPFVDPNYFKDKFGVEGKLVLLTFGLLSPNKGIEYVIEALPKILERFPNLVYIILGATHPHLIRDQGESYRLSLQRLVKSRGVQGSVIFHNRFVTLEELIEFIGCADLYVTPYLEPRQITSGTLAYSAGAGKAVISTPYWYAEDLLADGRGRLVPFRDSAAIAEQVMYLLEHEAERHAMRKRAYEYGRQMVWENVAGQYGEVFERARGESFRKPRRRRGIPPLEFTKGELPGIKLEHLQRLTDETGLLQHATFAIPNYDEGYTVDDNARAVVLTVLLEELGAGNMPLVRTLQSRYLAFLNHAWNPKTRRFRNFMGYDRRWLEEVGSEDSHGRALWALGVVAGRSRYSGLRGFACRLFDEALPPCLGFRETRAWAYSLLGMMEYMRRFYGHCAAQDARVDLAHRLLAMFERNASKEWLWFEDFLTYGNARLPHALFLCGQWLNDGNMVDAGLRALEWLVQVQRAGGQHFVPIGCHGFYRKGEPRARFDQQPIEANSTVAACLEAYRMTGEERWWEEALRAFDWFLGKNDLHMPLYHAGTGGCFDGLSSDRVNQNQGAESTVSFLMALAEMQLSEHLIREPDTEAVAEEPPVLPDVERETEEALEAASEAEAERA